MSMTPQSWKKQAVRLSVLTGFAVVFLFLFLNFRDQLTLAALSSREAELRSAIIAQPVLAYGVAFAIYVLVTGLSLPGASALTLVCGWLFGFWRALLLVSFASTAGATVAFLISRYLFREALQAKFGDRLSRFNAALEAEGAFYLFTLRLIPAVPFFVINVVMGLTPLKTGTFWWVSQLGMLPGTVVYVSAGASVPSLKVLAEKGTGGLLAPQLFAALVALGVFPFIVKRVMNVWRSGASAQSPMPSAGQEAAPKPLDERSIASGS